VSDRERDIVTEGEGRRELGSEMEMVYATLLHLMHALIAVEVLGQSKVY
jgi:hypothetical protein